jgi:glycosyltransferase involved in cell wall biosynthesis
MIKILFISKRGKHFDVLPFIKSQENLLREYGFEVTHLTIQSGLKSYLNTFFYVLRNSKNIDIIHSHYIYNFLLAKLASPFRKHILSFMGSDLYGFYDNNNELTKIGKFNKNLSKFSLKFIDSIIVKSNYMLNFLPDFYKNKAFVIPNSVDDDFFKPLDKTKSREKLDLHKEKKYILFLGDKNNPRKNYSLLIDSLTYLDNNVEIISPYPIEHSLLPYYYSACDVLAFPSLREGSPNVVKEAIFCSCPVVATNSGDLKEYLKKFDNCYLTNFDPVEFAAMLATVLQSNRRISNYKEIKNIFGKNLILKYLKMAYGIQ